MRGTHLSTVSPPSQIFPKNRNESKSVHMTLVHRAALHSPPPILTFPRAGEKGFSDSTSQSVPILCGVI
jgi:hypothetical protein